MKSEKNASMKHELLKKPSLLRSNLRCLRLKRKLSLRLMHKQLWILKVKYNRPWTPLQPGPISRLERAGKRKGRWPSEASIQQLTEFFGVSKEVLWPQEDFARFSKEGTTAGLPKRLQNSTP